MAWRIAPPTTTKYIWGARMNPEVFSVFIDYKCNFRCGHCSVGSTPETRLRVPEKELMSQIDEIATFEGPKVIAFTGGEATLHKDLLLAAIQKANSYNILTRLVTNAWWAKTVERAREFLVPFREAGLGEFNTSFDTFHEPFVTLDTIANAVGVALDLGFRVAVGTIKEPEEVWTKARVSEELAVRLGLSPGELRRRVYFIDDNGTPTGSGAEMAVVPSEAPLRMGIGCPQLLRTVSLHPDGSVKACCGHAIFYTNDLTIGKRQEESMSDMIERASRNLMYMWIAQRGPSRILQDLGVTDPYSGPCHACAALLTTYRDRAVGHLKEHRDEFLVSHILLDDSVKKIGATLLAQARARNEEAHDESVEIDGLH